MYHNLATISKKEVRSQTAEIKCFKTETKLLEAKYNTTVAAALELHRNIEKLVKDNFDKLKSLLEYSLNITNRFKILMLYSLTKAKFTYIAATNSEKENETECYVENTIQEIMMSGQFESLSEEVKRFINFKLLSPDSSFEYFKKLLALCMAALNNTYFNIPLKEFYVEAASFILEDKQPDKIISHPNFHFLVEINIILKTLEQNFSNTYYYGLLNTMLYKHPSVSNIEFQSPYKISENLCKEADLLINCSMIDNYENRSIHGLNIKEVRE